MGLNSGCEVKLAAVEQDSCSVVGELPEATCCRLDRLNSAVEALADSVGDFIPAVSQQVLQMTMNRLGHLCDRCQLAANRPAEPAFEELPCSVRIMVSPENTEVLLDGPSLGRL